MRASVAASPVDAARQDEACALHALHTRLAAGGYPAEPLAGRVCVVERGAGAGAGGAGVGVSGCGRACAIF